MGKRGRPISENPKDYLFRVRFDKEILWQLDVCCEATGKNKSEMVRELIQEKYEEIKRATT